MRLASNMAGLVGSDSELELFAPPATGVLLWRPRSADTRAVQERLGVAFESLAEVVGETWLRSVAANPEANPTMVVRAVISAIRRRRGDESATPATASDDI
jgi:L-2,4-diaminobutyrate decarboxylase